MSLEVREFNIREGEEERTVRGVAVPYGQIANIGGYKEKFERGSVVLEEGAMLFWRHDEPIGLITAGSEKEDGFHITAKISETPRGNEAYTLLKDGVIKKFSVGFMPLEQKEDEDVTVRTRALVKEVSLVPMPAYNGAIVEQVRESAPITEKEVIRMDDINEVREAVEALERKVSLINVVEEEVADTRTGGEVLKAIVAGDESTIRAYSGGTTEDAIMKNGWVGDLTKIVDEVSPLRNFFAKGALPAEGNTIEFGELDAITGTIAATAEGDDLDYVKVALKTRTADVKLFGGYVELTRQAIERSKTNILDASLRAAAVALGKALNANFRSVYGTVHTAQAGNAVTLQAGADYAAWLDVIVDAAVKFDTQGLSLDALVVDKDTFKSLAALEAEDGRPVFNVYGAGVNNVGSLSVTGLTGNLASVPVFMDAGLTSKNAFVNRNAIREYTNGVVHLQDENIINLSKTFSLYRFAAVAAEIPVGVVPVEQGS